MQNKDETITQIKKIKMQLKYTHACIDKQYNNKQQIKQLNKEKTWNTLQQQQKHKHMYY